MQVGESAAWGTQTIFTCKNCNLLHSFQYSSSDDSKGALPGMCYDEAPAVLLAVVLNAIMCITIFVCFARVLLAADVQTLRWAMDSGWPSTN